MSVASVGPVTPVGVEPSTVTCPSCKEQVLTRVVPRSSLRTHIIALLLCLTCLWPCAGTLYCTKCARDIEHYCPSCNTFIGTYKR